MKQFSGENVEFTYFCRDSANELATLQDCPKSVLRQFASLAVDEAAFGNPAKWNSIQVRRIEFSVTFDSIINPFYANCVVILFAGCIYRMCNGWFNFF